MTPSSAHGTVTLVLIASKILWIVGQPVSLTLLLVVVGFILTFTPFRKTARLSLFLGALILGMSAFTSAGYLMADALENRFTRPAAAPADVTGVIVLGGGMDGDVNTVRGGYELNRSGDRFVEAVRLAIAYPNARIVISGGGSVLNEVEEEATAGARIFAAFGIDENRLVLESGSRTTEENVEGIRALVSPQPGETWLLVTSAFHMPRSVGVFRKAGFPILPWPADYLSTGIETFGFRPAQPAENLSVTTLALREWVALAAYWLTGRIDAPFPAP